MNKLIMLGVGNGGVLNLYNTCFVIQNDNGNFLVDTGGGIEIIKRLNNVKIDFKSIKHIFISHSHTDHILGLFWYFKKISVYLMHNKVDEKITIYCNDIVYKSIKEISKNILPNEFMEIIYNNVSFIILDNNDKYNINGVEYTFFDINSNSTKQFGFECLLNDKKLIFLGDETLNEKLYDRVENANYAMHEAFCLDKEQNIFHPYEKNHSTVKSACKMMEKLNVKNLILYHTEESHKENRKKYYLDEGNKFYNGNLYIPDEYEEIIID